MGNGYIGVVTNTPATFSPSREAQPRFLNTTCKHIVRSLKNQENFGKNMAAVLATVTLRTSRCPRPACKVVFPLMAKWMQQIAFFCMFDAYNAVNRRAGTIQCGENQLTEPQIVELRGFFSEHFST